MKNTANTLFVLLLLSVAALLHGCSDSSPRVNDENCADTDGQVLMEKFKFKTDEAMRVFARECKSQGKGQWKPLDTLPEINAENCDPFNQAKFHFKTDELLKQFRQSCIAFRNKNAKSWLP